VACRGEAAAAGRRARLQGEGLAVVGQGHDAGLRCAEARGTAALMVAAHGLKESHGQKGELSRADLGERGAAALTAAVGARGLRRSAL
jgi:hypothetical protein